MRLIPSSRLFQEHRYACEAFQKLTDSDNLLVKLAETVDHLLTKYPSLDTKELIKNQSQFFLRKKIALTNDDIAEFINAHYTYLIQDTVNHSPEMRKRYFNYLTALCEHFKNHCSDKKIETSIKAITTHSMR